MRLGYAGLRGVDDAERRACEGGAGRWIPLASQRVVLLFSVHTPTAEYIVTHIDRPETSLLVFSLPLTSEDVGLVCEGRKLG